MRDIFGQNTNDNSPEANFNSDTTQGDESSELHNLIDGCTFIVPPKLQLISKKIIVVQNLNDTCSVNERHTLDVVLKIENS